jgi:hypothetical protein
VTAPAGPLHGVALSIEASGRPAAVAAWLLGGLGAQVRARDEPASARLVTTDTELPAAGLPPGTLPYCTGVALALAALAGWRAGATIEVHDLGVALQIWLPEVLAASYRSSPTMRPPPPRPAPGGGWVNADLGSPGDPELYDTLLATLAPSATAGEVAAAAQEWRLPVCDYRPHTPGASPPAPISWSASTTGPEPGRRPRPGEPPLAGVRICDMTAMWAGPLATWLLLGLGAEIHKVEPSSRPDGTRAIGGGGIHPDGRQIDPGRDSGLWNALNAGKHHHDLDLRDGPDRDAFAELAGSCDLVIDSFSRRVAPNLGVSELIGDGPRPARLALPAFPPGPHESWVAYGTGVHAAAGLGDCGDGSYAAPAVSYPDPMAGFTGALAAMAALTAGPGTWEASLLAAIAPLAATTAPRPGLACRRESDVEIGPALLGAAEARGLLACLRVGGRDLAHPLVPLSISPPERARTG